MSRLMIIGVVLGMIATLVILYFLIREIKKSIKDSNDGKISNRCELV